MKALKILDQQETGTCTKVLKIEVPRETIEQEVEDVYREFMQHASVPGFRKGKVTRHVVQMRYGKLLQEEGINKAVEKAVQDAVRELDVEPVTTPEVKDIQKENVNEPVVFEAQFEYRPKIEVSEWKDIQITPLADEVSETEVVETLNRLRESSAMYETVDDRGATNGDIVTISSTASIDGEPFPEATNQEIRVQLGMGRYIPGFEEQLEGIKAGEEKSFTLTLPDTYPDEEKRGKEATFRVTVKQVQLRKLPELDDEFAKDLGNYENLDQLKERIRHDLQHNQVHRREEKIYEDIRQELLNRNQFATPPSMVQARYNYINALQDMEYKRYGQSLEQMAQSNQGLLAQNEKIAEEEVRLSMILDAIARQEGLEVTDNEYAQYIYRLAQQSNADPRTYLNHIESQGLDSFYRRNAQEEKVMAHIRSVLLPELAQHTHDQEEHAHEEESEESQ